MKNNEKRIKKFINSIDYRDICYFINHVKDIDFRISLLTELGYKIGVEITKNENQICCVYVGKKNDLRMYITNKLKSVNIAYSVILDNY